MKQKTISEIERLKSDLFSTAFSSDAKKTKFRLTVRRLRKLGEHRAVEVVLDFMRTYADAMRPA